VQSKYNSIFDSQNQETCHKVIDDYLFICFKYYLTVHKKINERQYYFNRNFFHDSFPVNPLDILDMRIAN